MTIQVRNLLIVDDEEDLRDVLSHQMSTLNVHIDLAENGKRAFEMARAQTYDAILSDINMPEMSGLELLERLRASGIETPFVILTGFGEKNKVVEALRNGAFDFLEKPWESAKLKAVMQKALQLGERLREVEANLNVILTQFSGATPEQMDEIRRAHSNLRQLREKQKV